MSGRDGDGPAPASAATPAPAAPPPSLPPAAAEPAGAVQAAAALAAADLSTAPAPSEMIKLFAEFKAKFSKTYKSAEEEMERFQTYLMNIEAIEKMNPNLIYCLISGYGQTGPYSRSGCFDTAVQALSGLADFQGMLSTGYGEERMPQLIQDAVIDKTTAC